MNIKTLEKTLKSMNILYVEEDEKYNLDVYNAIKMKCDNVYNAKNLKDAADVYNDNKIDIIITELKFHNSNGLNFIKNIRKINKNIPIIVISNIIDIKVLLELMKLNLTEYIIKPIDILILKKSLHNAVLNMYDSGTFEIRFNNGTVYNVRKKLLIDEKNEVVKLAKNETKLLDLLVLNQEALLSVDDIKDIVWEYNFEISDEALKSLINRLRNKIGKESIKNISSVGYLIDIKSK